MFVCEHVFAVSRAYNARQRTLAQLRVEGCYLPQSAIGLYVIILRYITKEILLSTSLISLGLLALLMSGRFAKYLADAADGDIAAAVVFTILANRVPSFLELIIPLAVFISVLWTYGRMYVDSEMVVLFSCGFSRLRLLAYSLLPASILAALVALFTLYLSPLGANKNDILFEEQNNRTALELLAPARFQAFGDQSSTSYFESFSTDKRQMREVFIAQGGGEQVEDVESLALVVAATGEDYFDPQTQQRYLMLRNGFRYEGSPGQANFRITQFDTYRQYLPPREPVQRTRWKSDSLSTAQLLEYDTAKNNATFHWRLALPITVLVFVAVAIPLSHTNPRRGRYAKMLPGVLLCFFYIGVLTVGRGALDDEKIPRALGLWWVHGIFITIAVGLWLWNNGQPFGRLAKVKATAPVAEVSRAQD